MSLTTSKELLLASDVWNTEADKFAFTIIFWRDGEDIYRTEIPERIHDKDIDLYKLEKPSAPMDMTQFRGNWNPGLSEAPALLLARAYIKKPNLHSYSEDDNYRPGDIMVKEAELLEFIKKEGSHRNICEYYGCVRDGQFVTGLALKKYTKTLDEAIARQNVDQPTRKSLYRGILEGVGFMHSLGLTHNDLNPCNVMIGDSGEAVIIDFDSCARLGDSSGPPVKGGTYLWSREYDAAVAETEDVYANDSYSLDLLHNFLLQECPKITPGIDREKVYPALL